MKITWSERIGNELYVYYCGTLIYKKWYNPGTNKKSRSILLGHNGRLLEEII